MIGITTADHTSWLISALLASGMHGGLLFAFADQIGATTNAKTQTEISILDLPSAPGTTQLDVKPATRIRQDANTELKPIEENEAKHLEASSQKTVVRKSPNSAKIVKKVSKRPTVDPIKDVNSVLPLPSTNSIINRVPNAANLTAPIENKHEFSETISSQRIATKSSPTTISPKPQTTNVKTQSAIAEILNSQKDITKNLQPALTVKTTNINQNTKTAKLSTTINATRTQPSATKAKASKAELPNKVTPAIKLNLTRPTSLKALIKIKTSNSRPEKSTPISPQIAKSKASNPGAVPIKAIRPSIQKSNAINPVGRIKTMKSKTRVGSLRVSKYSGVKVAILARPKQITPIFKPLPSVDQADGFANVTNFLKFYSPENACFLALPSTSNQHKIELSGFSNEKSSWPRFQKALAQNTKLKITGRLASISDAQCQVVTFARQSSSYPSYAISIQLDFTSIRNGEFIAGKIFVDEGRYLNLLLVDDEGTAINLNRFVSIGENDTSFQLQVNLTSGAVATSQLLLAISTDQLLDSARSHAPTLVNNLLQDIKAEIETKSIKMDMALTAFEVK